MLQRVTGIAFGACLVASTAAAQVPGPEFKVSPFGYVGSHRYPFVASDPAGRFVVTWSRSGTLLGKRYDATAAPQGLEFVINQSAAGQVTPAGGPRPAYEADGGFVVAWAGFSNVMGRRYDAAGVPRGPEFVIGPPAGAFFPNPRVSAGPGGGFVVTWNDIGGYMRARRYDANGAGLPAIVVTTSTALSAVTMTPDGGFIVAWAPNAIPYTVWARFFDAASTPRGPAFPLAQGGNFKHEVEIASDSGGNFAVAWHDSGPGGTADDRGPTAMRFDSNGTALTGEIVLNSFTSGRQLEPSVASAPHGEFVVSWTSVPDNYCPPPPPPDPCPPSPPPQDGDGRGIFGRRLDAAGNFLGDEFQVNEYTSEDQEHSALAMDAGGRVIAVWDDWWRNGVYGRRFTGLVPAALDVDLTAMPGGNGNRVFEPGETVSIEPAWRNATGAPISYSGAGASLSGPAGGTYTMTDGAASYGTFPPGVTAGCRDQADCYAASIAGARPAAHWDAVLTEAFLPGGVHSTRWTVHVGQSFTDVPLSSPFYRFVETMLHHGVTGGCDAAGNYCPGVSVLREQMPVFVLRSYLPALAPAACVAGSERFADVPASSPWCRWIEELARRGVVTGCGGGNYCPSLAVTREQMAVYLGATLGLNPPACGIPVFGDVPASSPFCRWIEELARRGVVAGCGGGNYCPAVPVARDQMTVFLGATFGLTLYGP